VKRAGILIAALLLVTCAGPPAPPAPPVPRPARTGPLVIGYLGSWGVRSKGLRIADIRGSALTHIFYAFGRVERDGRAYLGNSCLDIGECGDSARAPELGEGGNFEQLRLLKQRYPQLKVLISLSGWGGSR
jgi:chitinase